MKQGLPPRVRWDAVENPSDLVGVGVKKQGNTWFTREFNGDAVDAMDFARHLLSKSGAPASSWRSDSGYWRRLSNGGIQFKPKNNLKIDFLPAPGAKSGTATLQVQLRCIHAVQNYGNTLKCQKLIFNSTEHLYFQIVIGLDS